MDVIKNISSSEYLNTLLKISQEHKYAVLGGAAAVSIAAAYGYSKSTSRQLPPGPRGWPIVGSSAIFNNEQFHEELEKLHKQYGDVVCVWLGGNKYWVILNGYDVIKEAYGDRGGDFMDRWRGEIWDHVKFEDVIFVSPFDEQYRANRKFCTQALRAAGFSKAQLDKRLAWEWGDLMEIFDSCPATGIDPDIHMKRAFTNIICGILYDTKMQYGDPELDEIADASADLIVELICSEANHLWPAWFSKLTQSAKRAKAKEATERVTEMIEKFVLEHQRTYDASNIRDFVDMCIKHGMLRDKGLRYVAHLCIVFMADSSVTVASMMMFLLIYMIRFPKYQQRMREEIQNAIETAGNGVALNLKEKAPFTEAFINEMFRIVTPAITSVPNHPLQTMTFRNYRIPRYFEVMANIYSVHYDPKLYPNPSQFNPDRFLENGKLKGTEALIPFGIGRRRCMGEQLVRSELFYFTAQLVTRYNIAAADGQLPDPTPRYTFVARTNVPFKAVFRRLKEE